MPAPADPQRLQEQLLLALLALEARPTPSGRLQSPRATDRRTLDALIDLGFLDRPEPGARLLPWTQSGIQAASKVLDALEGAGLPDLDQLVPQDAVRLHLAFDFRDLKCERELLVPADATFFDLHMILQELGNWLDYHLSDFTYELDGEDFELSEDPDDPERNYEYPGHPNTIVRQHVDRVRLSDVLPRVPEVVYAYGYGDNWHIRITLAKPPRRTSPAAPPASAALATGRPTTSAARAGSRSSSASFRTRATRTTSGFPAGARPRASSTSTSAGRMSAFATGATRERFTCAIDGEAPSRAIRPLHR